MRRLHAARAVLLASGLVCAVQAAAGELSANGGGPGAASASVALAEFERARMPSGLASLCLREPSLCQPVAGTRERLVLSSDRFEQLQRVNRTINHSIVSTTDEELYGRVEYWTLPGAAGDCEDYVLLKRKTLAAQGIDPAFLLITVVHDENGEGHAVLTIPTTDGDLVLDNRRDEVLHWHATGYEFVKRQSAADPNTWVSLGHGRLQATNFASGPEALSSK